MRPLRNRNAVATVLCLMGVLFSALVGARGFVLCTDHNDSRFEWSCPGSGPDGCISDDATTSHQPGASANAPCHDIVLKTDGLATLVGPSLRIAPLTTVHCPPAPALVRSISLALLPSVREQSPDPRPPDELARLRTVILLV